MATVNISVITSLYRCTTFLQKFLEHYARLENLYECELVLVHNDPTEEERRILSEYVTPAMNLHYISVPREGLYTSWNRGIEAARGRYIAIWNVDDIRNPRSLVAQKAALDESGAAMCYGDFYGTRTYGSFKDRLYEYEEYKQAKKDAFKRHIIGCFPMWRKEIHKTVGYFDEQFKLVSDYEWQLRVIRKYKLVKAKPILGYYLEHVGHKLSSNRSLQSRERTAVEWRYRMFSNILLHYLPFIVRFKTGYVQNFQVWVSVASLVPKRKSVKANEVFSFIGIPFTYGGWFVKRSLQTIGNMIARKEPKLP